MTGAETMKPARKTALITGASGGIGYELAKLCAQGGCNLVLVARSQAKLEEIAHDLGARYGVGAMVIDADLADPQAPARLADELKREGVAVDILINNAGFADFAPFAEADEEKLLQMMQVNMVTLTHLTRLLLPGMLARRSGRIMNVASTAAFMPGPLMAVYYASKAYVLSLSEALANELGGSGVTVTALCPGPTETGFQQRAAMEDSRLVSGRRLMDVASVAKAGYNGLMRGETVVIPGASNRVQAFLPRLLPRRLLTRVVRRAQERTH